jgi:mRNA-degrading endonuclease toxin of MazEF toxin-antitoxin module
MPHPPDLLPDALTYQTPVQFGMVYWVNFGYPSLPPGIEEKRILDWHPALVVSSDPFCRHAGAVNVVALTSYRGKLRPYHHLLLKRDYPLLDTDSLVKTELLYAVLRSLLADQYAICRLNDPDLRSIMGKIANSLAITMFYSLH